VYARKGIRYRGVGWAQEKSELGGLQPPLTFITEPMNLETEIY